MLSLLPFWIVPGLFLLTCLVLAAVDPGGRWRRPALYGLYGYVASFVVGTLGIMESRSSTAGLGFIFLPLVALVPGLLGAVLGQLGARRPPGPRERTRAFGVALAALGILGVLGFQAVGWYRTAALNATRDAAARRDQEAIRANTDSLERLLAQHPGDEARLITERAAATNDRTQLIPLARSRFAPPQVLDRLARSPDLGVALSAVRNPDTSAATLVWVYRHHPYSDYFLSTLASHLNTPPEILTELYDKRDQNLGIATGLARNPQTPDAIRERLAREQQPRP